MTFFPLADAETLGLVAHDEAARPLRVMTADGFGKMDQGRRAGNARLDHGERLCREGGKDAAASPADGEDGGAIAVMDTEMPLWDAARVASSLPAAVWRIEDADADGIDLGMVCLGWALSQYSSMPIAPVRQQRRDTLSFRHR